MIHLFAVAICSEFIARGVCAIPYWKCSSFGQAYWDAKAVEVLPGVIAAHLWRP